MSQVGAFLAKLAPDTDANATASAAVTTMFFKTNLPDFFHARAVCPALYV
jgi:hypothetical protein